MKCPEPRLEPELLSFLAPGKIERHAPPDVRARALANARAIIAANGRIPRATVLRFPLHLPARRRAPVWIPLAAAVGVAVAVAAAATLTLRRAPPPAPLSASLVTPLPNAVVRHVPLEVTTSAPAPLVAPLLTTAGPARRPRPFTDETSLPAELELLSRAQATYTRKELSRTLALLAEHARRFPNGHLAEEREALRVRSLARAGREDESRHAEAAFTRRFPRSVLLAHVGGPETSTGQ